MVYAKGTTTSVDASQQEITRVLRRYKVDTYAFANSPGLASVSFTIQQTPVRIDLPLPARPSSAKMRNPQTNRLVDANARWDQEVREVWRALVLLLKANLEAVERGIASVQQVFMAYLELPNGQTVGELVIPHYQRALESGNSLQLESGR